MMISQSTATENRANDSNLRTRPWQGLVIGVVSAFIVWIAIQFVHPVFRVPKEFDVPSIGMPTEMFLRHRREQDRVDRWHAALYLGGLGLLLSAGIGAREAMARRSLWPLVGAPLGAAGGAAGGVLGCMVLEHVRTTIGQTEILHTIEAQLAVAAPLGLGVGLGVGLAIRTASGVAKQALGGLAGGGLGGIAYALAIALVMPGTNTDALLPEEAGARLMWLAVVAAAIGLVTPLGARRGA